jgi:hypothetical protein
LTAEYSSGLSVSQHMVIAEAIRTNTQLIAVN